MLIVVEKNFSVFAEKYLIPHWRSSIFSVQQGVTKNALLNGPLWADV
jgi:hypothetical protein